jgi:hypothetical protein
MAVTRYNEIYKYNRQNMEKKTYNFIYPLSRFQPVVSTFEAGRFEVFEHQITKTK